MNIYKSLNLKALAIGVAVPLIGGIVVGFSIGFVLAFTGMSSEDAGNFMQTTNILFAGIIIGLTLITLGGWVGGQFTRRYRKLHGGIIGALCLILSLYALHGHPPWYGLCFILGDIPFGILGGHLSNKWRY